MFQSAHDPVGAGRWTRSALRRAGQRNHRFEADPGEAPDCPLAPSGSRRSSTRSDRVNDHHLRTYDFHSRHALVRIDVRGWTYTGVCQCGHVGPHLHRWPASHHDLLREHLDQTLRDEEL